MTKRISRLRAAFAAARGRDQPAVVRRLGIASFFQDVASEMVYPLLPGFLAALGSGPLLLGAMESAADGVVAFVKGWAGRQSDRVGRRAPFILFGYGASALARPLLALVTAPFQVVGLRLWDRLAKGVRSAPRDALIAESAALERRAEAFAYQRGLDHLGAAIGPLLAAALLAAGVSLRTVFLAATLPALAGVVTVALTLRRHAAAPALAAPPRHSTFAGAALGLRTLCAPFLFGLANASDAFLLLRASGLGVATPSLPLLWAGLHVVRWLTAARGGRWADRFGAQGALRFGWIAYGALYLGLGVVDSLPGWLLLLALYGAQAGLVEGAERSYAAGLATPGATGSTLGAWQRSVGLGALGASLLFGWLWFAIAPWAAFSLASAFAFAAAATLGSPARSSQR